VVICLTSYLAYVMLWSRQTNEVAQTSVVQPIPSGPTPIAQEINPPVTTNPTPKRRSTSAKAPKEDVGDAVRSGVTVPNLKLSEVKKIYIEIRGDASLNELRETLNSSGIVTATTNAEEADAALKIVGTSAILVNARGTVLWRGRIKDLLTDIRRARH